MDVQLESDLFPAEEMVLETERNFCLTPDRIHADALLDISADDAWESSLETGWDEAAQGWGRSPPLACLFPIQRKSSKSKAVDGDHHCLLCVDLKHAEESDRSTHSVTESERLCDSGKRHQCKGSKWSSGCLKGQSRKPSNQFPSATEHQIFKEALEQALCGDEGFLEADQLAVLESENSLSMEKRRAKTAEGDAAVAMIVSSYSVLPPVTADGAGVVRCPSPSRKMEASSSQSLARCISGGERSPGQLGAGVSTTVEEICEYMKRASMDVIETHYGPLAAQRQGLPGLQRPSQPSGHLRFALGIQNAKRRYLPLSMAGDLFPRTGYHVVNSLKCEDLNRGGRRNHHGNRLYIALKAKSLPDANPQLPALLGTRVPLPVSSHRLL